jgi:gag-polyprotein putative aspartyl protease
MICRRCKTENPEASRYCSACGALLTHAPTKPKRTMPWAVVAAAGALLGLAAAYVLLPGLRPHARPVELAASQPDAAAATPSGAVISPSDPSLAVGRFALDGLGGDRSDSLEGALFDGSWAALPLWAFLGPEAPRLEGPGPSALTPSWLDWNSPEPLVLCRFEVADGPRTPELAPYSEAAVLEWRPLSGERTSYAIETGSLRPAGSFKTFALFGAIAAPGVLVQEGRIVGWTFGRGVSRGYLWSPADGAGPKPTLTPADLAGLSRTLGSREAAFVQALSMSDEVASARRLEAFAAGFRRPALLSPEDLPDPLKPAAVAARMSSLAANMVEGGLAAEAVRLLDPAVLAAVSDLGLVKAASRAYNNDRGFDSAHRLLADLRREPPMQGASASRELDAVEVELAKAALHKVLNERGYGALDIFETASRIAPDDLELHLLGVEAALLEQNFGRASDLLGSKQYPTAFSDKVRTLERLVDEGRREEDSVTIRFAPGAKLIPVYAVLNKKHRQKFFIDTGATTTIIPTAAVAALGIRIDNTTPVVGFQGVAGSDLAYQVRLESIEVERQTVFDIRAIVYDLGEDENAGLLGNDFLQHFQVDLDSIKGVLKLRKK